MDDINDPGAKSFCFQEGEDLFQGFLVRSGPNVLGYIDRCPHAGFPLALEADRYLTKDGDAILCSSHGALFRIQDGLCLAGPCAGKRLKAWEISVQNGEISAR